MKRFLAILCLGLGLAVLPAPILASAPAAAGDKFDEILATPEQLAALRKGGFVLYLRHGYTDNTRPDRVPTVDLNDCGTQRPLNEEGRKVATKVGNFMRRANIPLGEAHISPLCRVKETTALAFPRLPHRIDNDLMYVANLTRAQKAPIIARTRALLSQAVKPGENRLIVAHAPNMMELMGYFPKEATLIIFRPLGGDAGFTYVASIPPDLWPNLPR